jgi:hypothetical protein
VAANILIDGLKRTGNRHRTAGRRAGKHLATWAGVPLALPAPTIRPHKVWGTALDETGRYQPLELE